MSEISTVLIRNTKILVKREDLLHPFVSGNKFRKLKYNLLQALELGASEIISFGGAFSNHIHALAYACKTYDIPLVLFVRGENQKNPTLEFVRSTGAQLIFVSRSEYRLIKTRKSFPEFPNAFVVPEGGSNKLALKGIGEMMTEIKIKSGAQFCVPYGSGATSIGMMTNLRDNDHLHIFSALKMRDLSADFQERCSQLGVKLRENITLHNDFHFGGFAKFDSSLIEFINNFPIPLDPIYTGKMMYGIDKLIQNEYFDKRPIIAIHTGGLQGVKGFNMRFNNLLNPERYH